MRYRSMLRMSSVVTAIALLAAGCGKDAADGADGAGQFEAGPTELVVHTGPGGGSDVFAREIVALMERESLVEKSAWTVRNESGGSGTAAMAYLLRLTGKTGTVAMTTPTWITTPLTTAGAAVTLDKLTPIAQLVTEPLVMAVRADAPYQNLQDFIAAAKRTPGALVQAGGSPTSVDAISAEVIKKTTGTDWNYLPFEGGGERIAAVLSGDAHMMFGSPSDFGEQVRAGKMRVIATIGDKATAMFPNAQTLPAAGLDIDVPEQQRGLVGPPGMPAQAVAHYQDLMQPLTQTSAWKTFVDDNGLTTVYADSKQFGANIKEQTELLRSQLDSLGLLAK